MNVECVSATQTESPVSQRRAVRELQRVAGWLVGGMCSCGSERPLPSSQEKTHPQAQQAKERAETEQQQLAKSFARRIRAARIVRQQLAALRK